MGESCGRSSFDVEASRTRADPSEVLAGLFERCPVRPIFLVGTAAEQAPSVELVSTPSAKAHAATRPAVAFDRCRRLNERRLPPRGKQLPAASTRRWRGTRGGGRRAGRGARCYPAAVACLVEALRAAGAARVLSFLYWSLRRLLDWWCSAVVRSGRRRSRSCCLVTRAPRPQSRPVALESGQGDATSVMTANRRRHHLRLTVNPSAKRCGLSPASCVAAPTA
jgi:hypothetical protein